MAQNFTTALANLETHLVAAGTAITPNITDVGAGEAGTPAVASIRYWYNGDGDPARMARRTLTRESVGERVTIQALWAVASRDKPIAASLEARVRALKVAIKTALNGDSDLGASCESILVGDAEAGWLNAGGGTWRSLNIPLTIDMTDTDTIAR